jgi:hypothetical protein
MWSIRFLVTVCQGTGILVLQSVRAMLFVVTVCQEGDDSPSTVCQAGRLQEIRGAENLMARKNLANQRLCVKDMLTEVKNLKRYHTCKVIALGARKYSRGERSKRLAFRCRYQYS